MVNITLFLIDHYYLSVPLFIAIILLIRSHSQKGGKRISCQELIALANADDMLLVDLRPSDDFDKGHITGAISIPFNTLENSTYKLQNSDKSIVLVCEMGSQSGNGGEILNKDGLDDILILKGGIAEWRQSNLPLV